MLSSITPLGERGRGASWRRTVTSYVIGSLAGGAAMGAALGTLASLVGIAHTRHAEWLVVIAGAAALVAALLDLTRRVPTLRRQVNETWMTRYRDWVYGAGFGMQLGLGAVTIVTSASLYLAWLVELLLGDPLRSALVGAAFGLARALPLLGTRHLGTPDALRVAQRRWQERLPAARWMTIAVETAAGIALIGWAA